MSVLCVGSGLQLVCVCQMPMVFVLIRRKLSATGVSMAAFSKKAKHIIHQLLSPVCIPRAKNQ